MAPGWVSVGKAAFPLLLFFFFLWMNLNPHQLLLLHVWRSAQAINACAYKKLKIFKNLPFKYTEDQAHIHEGRPYMEFKVLLPTQTRLSGKSRTQCASEVFSPSIVSLAEGCLCRCRIQAKLIAIFHVEYHKQFFIALCHERPGILCVHQ